MNTHTQRPQKNTLSSGRSPTAEAAPRENEQPAVPGNRPEAVQMQKLFAVASNAPQALQVKAFREIASNTLQAKQSAQLRAIAQRSDFHRSFIPEQENHTGLPDQLKSGIENLSGYPMDDVKVHYHADRPAQLHAHAYTRGTEIHVAPRQEKHLPHEAWHVVQQKQGRVRSVLQKKRNVNINDDAGLEKEADEMGTKALNSPQVSNAGQDSRVTGKTPRPVAQRAEVVQCVRIEPKSIHGLTHLVQMTDEGRIYTGESWLENERDEVKTGDKLLVDMDDAWYSHRGIHQEVNWQRDGEGEQDHLWIGVVELNHASVEKGMYVREEMLSEGWPEWTEGPKTMHSIWVQGDVHTSKEAMEGIQSRRGEDMEGWVDMIWLYDTGVERGEYSPQKVAIDSAKMAPLWQRSFKHEMELWKEDGTMPKWVENWLPILEILYQKKSYITMSDLMRMIILYYEGGVYLDVKIKVQPDKAMFKDRPMIKINQANFYANENWAIMAHAGCQMIEAMMTEAFERFPKEDELETYPENYREEPQPDGRRREGKMHVKLHEQLGVWSVIDRAGRPGFPTSLNLQNPRPVNSWSDAYEDRPIEVIRAEQQRQREDDLGKLRLEKIQKERDRSEKQQLLTLKEAPQFWEQFEITQEIMEGLPGEIEELNWKIELLEMEYELLRKQPLPCDQQDDDEQDLDLLNLDLPSVPVGGGLQGNLSDDQ